MQPILHSYSSCEFHFFLKSVWAELCSASNDKASRMRLPKPITRKIVRVARRLSYFSLFLLLSAFLLVLVSFNKYFLEETTAVPATTHRPLSNTLNMADYLTPQQAPTILHEVPEQSTCDPEHIKKGFDSSNGGFCINPENPQSKGISGFPLIPSLCKQLGIFLANQTVVDFGAGFGYFGRCLLGLREYMLPGMNFKDLETQRLFSWVYSFSHAL